MIPIENLTDVTLAIEDTDDNDDNDDNDGILMKLLTTFRLQLLGEYFNYFLRLIKILLAATWSIF